MTLFQSGLPSPMPLITDIAALKGAVLRYRRMLYHTCQLSVFRSYLELGGIPSRNLLVSRGLPFTAFDTDNIDRKNGVWDKVFFNFSDFGLWFSNGGPGLPSPYGPICLALNVSVLDGSSNASVTLRSAGADGYDREAEGLTMEEFPRLFEKYGVQKFNVRLKEALQAEFPGREVGANPEMNCGYPAELGPIGTVRYVLVDPYRVTAERPLENVVAEMMARSGLDRRVIERKAKPDPSTIYATLWRAIGEGALTIDALRGWREIDKATIAWIDRLRGWDPNSFYYTRFSRYLKAGTIDGLE